MQINQPNPPHTKPHTKPQTKPSLATKVTTIGATAATAYTLYRSGDKAVTLSRTIDAAQADGCVDPAESLEIGQQATDLGVTLLGLTTIGMPVQAANYGVNTIQAASGDGMGALNDSLGENLADTDAGGGFLETIGEILGSF
ncbi:hypothetical protein HDV00_011464 [Rhizophlyctis rosea]|nr:hypothetical protein HDV00_011464 [Rhizophlyctis rosea]